MFITDYGEKCQNVLKSKLSHNPTCIPILLWSCVHAMHAETSQEIT